MTAFTLKVQWLMSRYDGLCHAFPEVQFDDTSRTFYEALCEHSVPTSVVERGRPSVFCPVCLARYGERILDELVWSAAG